MVNKNKFFLLLTMLVIMIAGCGGGQVSSSSTTSTTGGTGSGGDGSLGGTGSGGDSSLYTGNAILSWSTPTQYSDGSPLAASDITGYNVYTGSSSRTYAYNHLVSASTTSVRIRDLNVPKGPLYVAVTTLDKAGYESDYSSEVSTTLN
jgi:hypothetical protein